MPLQTSTQTFQGSGKVGTVIADYPRVSFAGILNSTDSSLNQVGRAVKTVAGADYTYSVDAAEGAAGVVYGGIIVDSNQYINFGIAGDPLAPTLTLPNNQPGIEIMRKGGVMLNLGGAATRGQAVFRNTTDGTLVAGDKGGSVTDHVEIENSEVIWRDITTGLVAVLLGAE